MFLFCLLKGKLLCVCNFIKSISSINKRENLWLEEIKRNSTNTNVNKHPTIEFTLNQTLNSSCQSDKKKEHAICTFERPEKCFFK